MKGEKGARAWVHSGQKSRFIDQYMKKDKALTKKTKDAKRKSLNVEEAVEKLLNIMNSKKVNM